MKTRPERDLLQTAQCIYIIPCECGRSYIGETGRPLAVRLREHRHNLMQLGLLVVLIAQISTSFSVTVPRMWVLHHNFYCVISCYHTLN
jgi:hypothetical protein